MVNVGIRKLFMFAMVLNLIGNVCPAMTGKATLQSWRRPENRRGTDGNDVGAIWDFPETARGFPT
jgi:hypothetical protein